MADPVVVSNQPDHPYREISDNQRWHRAVTWAPPGGLDPVVSTRFGVGPDDLIGTMGSCFAQHLSRHLFAVGARVLRGRGRSRRPRRSRGSASPVRHLLGPGSGNVYTAAQAIQLFRRAYGDMVPIEGTWTRGSVFVDPFRPAWNPTRFRGRRCSRRGSGPPPSTVREVFERSTVLVFTLGLTEAWRSRDDGAVFATAPGVDGGVWDPDRYEFVNYGVDKVRSHLFELCDLVRSVNPGAKILLTVSPVPLVATYEPRHVLVSTTVSKAVLRVAAEEALARFDFVDYFPSYELIASATGITDSYEPDRRSVTRRSACLT